MWSRLLVWSMVLSLAGLSGCVGHLSVTEPEEVASDDDVDPWGDDDDGGLDDDTPTYEGTVDMDGSELQAMCVQDDSGEVGEWGFRADLAGWAGLCWVELRLDDYCEGFDGDGEPCEEDGIERPGWDLLQGPFGHDEEVGFWDVWARELPFETAWPPGPGVSTIACDDEPEVLLCCTDAALTDLVECRGVDGR